MLIQAKEDGCYELLLLELSAGLRRGELLALQWDDLDLGTGELRISRQVSRVRGKLTVSQPKTDAAVRTIVLSPAVTEQLRRYRKRVDSRWIFPSPKKEDAPRDPAAVRKLLSRVLKRAQCPKVRFHDLRHTFVTTALEYGMDVKTLSAVVGHRSSSTTLNVYTHVTKAMERQAAAKIDQGIGKQEAPQEDIQETKHPTMTTFRADPGKRRKPGTGCVHQIGGQAVFSQRAGRQAALPERLRPHPGRVRGEAESSDCRHESEKRNSRGCGSFPVCGISVVNQKRRKIVTTKKQEEVTKSKEKNLISREIRFFLVKTTGLEPVTSCV